MEGLFAARSTSAAASVQGLLRDYRMGLLVDIHPTVVDRGR
jgi:hypothetical protein